MDDQVVATLIIPDWEMTKEDDRHRVHNWLLDQVNQLQTVTIPKGYVSRCFKRDSE